MGRKRFPPKMSGLLLVDKPAGITSHDVVQQARRRLGERRIGHTGTLDPMATGLLVLAVGHTTRLASYVEASEKRYEGRIRLGQATTTYDAEGDIIEEAAVGEDCLEKLPSVFEKLHGAIEQAVPAYSAVKVNGERLYQKARRGEDVETPTRTVLIKHLELLDVNLPELSVDVLVSKGTYIRSLAVQIGEGLGLPAHLCGLRRTSVGRFRVEDAVELEDISPDRLLHGAEAVAHLDKMIVGEIGTREISFGRALSPEHLHCEPGLGLQAGHLVRLLDEKENLCAVARLEKAPDQWKPGVPVLRYACVLNSGDQVH